MTADRELPVELDLDRLLGFESPAGIDDPLHEDAQHMLAHADAVATLERLRLLRVEPSARYAARLNEVVGRAERRRPAPPRRPWRELAGFTVAAAATVAVLFGLDPLAPSPAQPSPLVLAGRTEPAADGAAGTEPLATVLLELDELRFETAVSRVRERIEQEQAPRLRAALERGLQAVRDPLAQWIEPRNSVALWRLEHELRARAELRAALLRAQGGLPAADTRVQQLAQTLTEELAAALAAATLGAAPAPEVLPTALAVRALLAAGPSPRRDEVVLAASERLVEALPQLRGESLTAALAALVEVAAVDSRFGAAVARHGARFVDEMLWPDEQNWQRRRPELLNGRLAPSVLGEASRVLGWLPAFGVDGGHCRLLRELLLGQLRERRDAGQDRPEVLAAILYGCGELLAEPDRDQIEFELRRWKPVRLAPDFVTVQQLAWGFAPGRRGFSQLQGELRQLAVLPEPRTLVGRAAFCLCLATGYAGHGGLTGLVRGA